MPQGKTLWEMFLEHFEGPVEMQFYNPLKARVGGAVMIDLIDWRDRQFRVQEIREYRRHIEGKSFTFVDYVLLDRPLGQPDLTVRLRINPVADPTKVAGLQHQVLLLQLFDEMPYDEGLHQVVNDTTRRFEVIENGQVTEEYWRLHDVVGPYKAQVSVLQDTDRDGKAEKQEVQRVQLEYWDYWREIQDAAGQALAQFLFVEMDKRTGWFQIWRGEEVDPQKVFVV
jgi:hypothetical protein